MKNVYHKVLPIYGDKLVFVTDMKAADKFYKSIGHSFSESTGEVVISSFSGFVERLQCVETGECYNVIGIFDGSKETLVHEIGHLALDICAGRGVPVEPFEANEAFCYLLGHLYSMFAGYLND